MNVRTIVVYGEALPQGSKSGRYVKGRVILTEGFGDAPKRRKLWREAIGDAARAWLKENDAPAPFDIPVAMGIVFYLSRPKSAPKSVIVPAKKPDLDKLTRQVGDALSGLFYTDDARVVSLIVAKRFAVDSPPRAEITVAPWVEA